MPGMKTVKRDHRADKAERRSHREAKASRRGDGPIRVQTLGPGTMDPDLVARITEAAERVDLSAPWCEVSHMVLPVLRRVWQPLAPGAEPVHLFVPPGVWTGFGLDFGPAFTHITATQVEQWGVDTATLLGTALENLRALTVVEPPRVERFRQSAVDTMVVQGQGWGSALVLLPDVLGPILGPRPKLLLAPVRNALVALPEDVDATYAMVLWEVFAEGAHDELDPIALRWTGTGVVLDGGAELGLPN